MSLKGSASVVSTTQVKAPDRVWECVLQSDTNGADTNHSSSSPFSEMTSLVAELPGDEITAIVCMHAASGS